MRCCLAQWLHQNFIYLFIFFIYLFIYLFILELSESVNRPLFDMKMHASNVCRSQLVLVYRAFKKGTYSKFVFICHKQNICCGYSKRTVTLRLFFRASKTYDKNWWVRKYLQFYDQNVCLSKPMSIFCVWDQRRLLGD